MFVFFFFPSMDIRIRPFSWSEGIPPCPRKKNGRTVEVARDAPNINGWKNIGKYMDIESGP